MTFHKSSLSGNDNSLTHVHGWVSAVREPSLVMNFEMHYVMLASQRVNEYTCPQCPHVSMKVFFMNLCRGTDAWNRRFNMEDGCAEVEIFGNFELRPLFSSFPPVTAQEVEALPSGCSWSAGHVWLAGIVVDLKIWDVKSIGFAFVLEINHVEILVSTFVSFVQAFHMPNVTVK